MEKDDAPDVPMLMCWLGYDESTKTHDQKPIRDLDVQELAAEREATGFLNRFILQSPFAELKVAHDDLRHAIAALESSLPGTAGPPEAELGVVHLAFKNWLSAVRTFDDSTSHLLAEKYGKDSSELERFRSLLSDEYDAEFSYRLAVQLRNASLHVARTINSVAAKSTVASDGQPETRVALGFDGPKLAQKFPKIKFDVRSELEAMSAILPVEHLVSAVMGSSTRTYASLLFGLRDDVERHSSVLEGLHSESTAQGGQAASVWWTLPGGDPTGAMAFRFHWIEVHLAWTARAVLEQCARVVAAK